MSPKRIQRQRTKGWRMPDGAVYVGRPAWWGNPFRVEAFGAEGAVELYRNALIGHWNPNAACLLTVSDGAFHEAYSTHTGMRESGRSSSSVRFDLRGRDLACWCPLDQPCHADVLLELANVS